MNHVASFFASVLKSFPSGVLLLGLLAGKLVAETAPPVALQFRAGLNATEGQGIAVGTNGVIYATGQFINTGTFGAFTLTNGGSYDYYLAAYSPTGQVLWAQRAGTAGADFGSDVIVDRAGDVVVVGVIQGTNDFHGVTNVAGFGKKDIFLAKYATNGALQWVRLAGGAEDDQCYDVAVDGANNYFISGRIASTANFGGTTIGAASQYRCYLAKYTSNGDFLWVRDVGDTGSTPTTGVAADTNGNAYITGSSATFLNVGPFVAKYNASGTQLWKTVIAGINSSFEEGSGVSVDGSGNVYVAGRFTAESMTFGSTTLTNTGSVPRGFIAKFDSAGNALWAKTAGARGFDVEVTADGTVYLAGFSSGFSTPKAVTLDTETLANFGGLGMFAAKLTTSGAVVWVKSASTGTTDLTRAITHTANDSTFIIGEGGSGLFPSPSFPGGVFIAELRPAVIQPTLGVSLSGTNLIVSWPASITGYNIETTSALGTAFQSNGLFSAVAGQTNVYFLPKPAANLFIRLVKP